ncbi:MAG: hypothetical protein EXS05_14645 [Planctomycetaceae bacterium]|nr:hypothetical protein [Planctomycetaceae bacterium]
MSEPIHAERHSAPAGNPATVSSRVAPGIEGVAWRIDAAHLPPGELVEPASPSDNSAPGGAAHDDPVAIGYAEHGSESPVATASEIEAAHALQATQITAHLRQQHAELDRREQRLHVQLAQFDQERRETRMWSTETETALHERELAIERQEATLAQRADACLTLETEFKQFHESLLRERQSLCTQREQFIIDRDRDRQELDEYEAARKQELELRHEDFLTEQEQLRGQLRQETVLLDNRHRFQQDHLRRSMHEFEAVQAEFRREQQVGRTRLEEIQIQNLLRARQLVRWRELVLQQQKSVEREREMLYRERRNHELRHQQEQDLSLQEREAWEHERDVQRSDLRRHQDLLALHAENIETRRQRLDRLRSELEETNRQTLELRLAVEESYAQLMQTAGDEATRRRIDEARAVLAEYYRHTRDALIQDRQELEQVQQRLSEQRHEFTDERHTLTEWIGRREERLAHHEAELAQQRTMLEAREQTWRSTAERWTREKLEAESVIRDLLGQLLEKDGASSG